MRFFEHFRGEITSLYKLIPLAHEVCALVYVSSTAKAIPQHAHLLLQQGLPEFRNPSELS